MSKSIARILAIALILAVCSMPLGMTASANYEDQPQMHAALEALRQAEQHLKEAEHDKGGHREQALKATEDAIHHVEMGIKVGAEHEHHK